MPTESNDQLQIVEAELEVAKFNEKNIFQPYWIPYYLVEEAEFNMTPLETKVYGFIRKVMENPTIKDPRFYFKSEDLAFILNSTVNSVNSAIKELKNKNIIETVMENNAPYGSRRYVSGYKVSEKTLTMVKVPTPTIIKVPTPTMDQVPTPTIIKLKELNYNPKTTSSAAAESDPKNPNQHLSSVEEVQSSGAAPELSTGTFRRSKIGSALNDRPEVPKKPAKRARIVTTAAELAVFQAYKEKVRPDAEIFSPGVLEGIRTALERFKMSFNEEASAKLVEAISLKMSEESFIDYVSKNKGILTPPAFFSEKFIFNSLLPTVLKTPAVQKDQAYGKFDKFKYETQDWWEKHAPAKKTTADIEREVLGKRAEDSE